MNETGNPPTASVVVLLAPFKNGENAKNKIIYFLSLGSRKTSMLALCFILE